MKIAFLGILVLSLLIFEVNQARAEHCYSEYPYYWFGSNQTQYLDPQQYDPYYQLHQIHYQLYRQQYNPTCCVPVVTIQGWPKYVRVVRFERKR